MEYYVILLPDSQPQTTACSLPQPSNGGFSKQVINEISNIETTGKWDIYCGAPLQTPLLSGHGNLFSIFL